MNLPLGGLKLEGYQPDRGIVVQCIYLTIILRNTHNYNYTCNTVDGSIK